MRSENGVPKFRTKGRKGEVEVADLAKACGCVARVTARRQTKHSDLVPDVTIEQDGRNIRVEVKRRRSIPSYLLDWLKGNDMLVIREDGPMPVNAPGKHRADTARWIAVVPAEYLFGLIAESNELIEARRELDNLKKL